MLFLKWDRFSVRFRDQPNVSTVEVKRDGIKNHLEMFDVEYIITIDSFMKEHSLS